MLVDILSSSGDGLISLLTQAKGKKEWKDKLPSGHQT